MMPTFRAPARFRRALFVSLALLLGPAVPCLTAQRGIPVSPNIGQLGAPDAAEAADILERFRALGMDGDYYLEFELRVMPRRGAESLHTGRLWGGRSPGGDLSRVVIGTGAGQERLLVRAGADGEVWRSGDATGAERVADTALFEPLLGTDLTAFDLLRPFVHWADSRFEGIFRARGRPAYRYLLRPSPEFAAAHPETAAVRIYLDTAYNALVQTVELDASGTPLKTMAVQELKKIGDRWTVKTIDLRNERTGDRTRFQVRAAALGIELSPAVFAPERLGLDLAPPSGLVEIAP
jgi:hypothetical protein